MTRYCFALLFSIVFAASVHAQTCPQQASPAFPNPTGSVFGALSSTWKQYFAAKVDANGGTLCNPTFSGSITGGAFVNPAITGGTITGSTISNLAAPLAANSGGTGSTSLGPEFTKTGGSGNQFDIISGGVTSSMLASGAAAANLGSGTANQIFAAPDGSSGTGSFRAMVFGDLPTGTANAVMGTNGSGAWSAMTTLPSGLTIPSPTISGTLTGPSGTWTSSGLSGLAGITATNALSSLPSTLANVPGVLNQTLTGSALGTSGAGFNLVDKAAALHITFTNDAGYNTDTGDGNDQSGATATYYDIETAHGLTLGATAAITVHSTVYGQKAGATDFLANASVQMLTGQLNAGEAGVYLNPLEYSLYDQGFDVAAEGLVINESRTVNTAALNENWIGVHILSFGSVAADAALHIVGKFTIGANFVGMSSGTAAIATAAGVGWYGNATNSCLNVRPIPACESLGSDEIVDAGPGWSIIVGTDNPLKILPFSSHYTQLLFKSGLDIIGGSSTDPVMYFDAPAGGDYNFQINGTSGVAVLSATTLTLGTGVGLTFTSLPSGTAATYACFTSGGALVSSAAAC